MQTSNESGTTLWTVQTLTSGQRPIICTWYDSDWCTSLKRTWWCDTSTSFSKRVSEIAFGFSSVSVVLWHYRIPPSTPRFSESGYLNNYITTWRFSGNWLAKYTNKTTCWSVESSWRYLQPRTLTVWRSRGFPYNTRQLYPREWSFDRLQIAKTSLNFTQTKHKVPLTQKRLQNVS